MGNCGTGGHAANCPTLVRTTCLTDGGPEAGEFQALPGSHTTSHPFIDGNAPGAPTGVPVSVLLAFSRLDAMHHRGERHYNDALLTNADGQVQHIGHTLR